MKNKNLNNIDSIIDYQNFNEDLYNQGLISDKTYNTYNKKINNKGAIMTTTTINLLDFNGLGRELIEQFDK